MPERLECEVLQRDTTNPLAFTFTYSITVFKRLTLL